jgi:hypothetical protein
MTTSSSTPATYPNNIPLSGKMVPSVETENRGCFGCGVEGHMIGQCTEIQELLKAGVITHDEQTHRLKMSDGNFIRRNYMGEPLAQAAKRQAVPRVMLGLTDECTSRSFFLDSQAYEMWDPVQRGKPVEAANSYIENMYTTEYEECTEAVVESDSEEGEDDLELGEVYLTIPRRRTGKQVNEAERTVPSTRAARRQAFDGVHVPRREKSYEKEAATTTPPTKTAVGKIHEILADVQPYDARRPRFSEPPDVEMRENKPEEKNQS